MLCRYMRAFRDAVQPGRVPALLTDRWSLRGRLHRCIAPLLQRVEAGCLLCSAGCVRGTGMDGCGVEGEWLVVRLPGVGPQGAYGVAAMNRRRIAALLSAVAPGPM